MKEKWSCKNLSPTPGCYVRGQHALAVIDSNLGL